MVRLSSNLIVVVKKARGVHVALQIIKKGQGWNMDGFQSESDTT